jgi:toxic protein SymE
MADIKKQNNKLQVRNLKVYDKIFLRGGRVRSNHQVVLYPEIRLIGKWLQDCGFRPGQHIEVITELNRLTIRHREEKG